jgi:phosphoribosyl-AMP cyclohydrolase
LWFIHKNLRIIAHQSKVERTYLVDTTSLLLAHQRKRELLAHQTGLPLEKGKVEEILYSNKESIDSCLEKARTACYASNSHKGLYFIHNETSGLKRRNLYILAFIHKNFF